VRDQGQLADSLVEYSRAVDLLTPIVPKGRVASAQVFLRNVHWDRANALGQLGRHAEAVEDWQKAFDFDDGPDRQRIGLFRETAREEDRLKGIAPGANDDAGARFYTAARLFAQAAGAAAPDEAKLSQHYAGRAMQLLEQARAAGFFRAPQRIE